MADQPTSPPAHQPTSPPAHHHLLQRLTEPLPVRLAPNFRDVAMGSPRNQQQLARHLRGRKDLAAHPRWDDGVSLSVSDENRNVQIPNTRDRVVMHARNEGPPKAKADHGPPRDHVAGRAEWGLENERFRTGARRELGGHGGPK